MEASGQKRGRESGDDQPQEGDTHLQLSPEVDAARTVYEKERKA
jgi:hypothetical protein